MWLKIKLREALIVVLDTCKNDEDQSKMITLACSQHYFYYKAMDSFSDDQGQLTP